MWCSVSETPIDLSPSGSHKVTGPPPHRPPAPLRAPMIHESWTYDGWVKSIARRDAVVHTATRAVKPSREQSQRGPAQSPDSCRSACRPTVQPHAPCKPPPPPPPSTPCSMHYWCGGCGVAEENKGGSSRCRADISIFRMKNLGQLQITLCFCLCNQSSTQKVRRAALPAGGCSRHRP